MLSKAVTHDLLWDSAALEAVDESQQWIVSAMQRHGHELVTMLWRILGNDQDVCDAYQTTFLHLAHQEGGCKPRRLKPYLFRTASNAAISMLRRRLAERKMLSNMTGTTEAPTDLGRDFDTRHLTENLRSCLAELPAHLRDVIMLRDLGELSYREVARSLGISVGTARVYRCKAIQLLAAWMKTEEEK